MRPPVPRFVRWAVALAVIAALTLVVFQYWGTSQYGSSPPASTPSGATVTGSDQVTGQNPDWTQTRWGLLGPADRDLLVMIRQAGLCGGSSGHQAQQQGSNPQVRTVAKTISVDYSNLDNQVRSVASKLGVALPNQPTAQQQAWMKELSGQSGGAYDRMFAQHLRLTDGEVLPAIMAVRAGTRNELIRSFAANAAMLMNRHMDVLERTGLVDYSKLPAPPPPTMDPAAGPAQDTDQVVSTTPVTPVSATGNDANAMVAALVSIAALLVALGLLGSAGRRIRRPSIAQHRPQQRRHAAHRW